MDALKAEIATKRKAIEVDGRPSKYMRRGDLERLREQEEAAKKAAEREAKEKEKQAAEERARAATKSKETTRSPSRSSSVNPGTPSNGERAGSVPAATGEAFNISIEETIRRLRQKGQPIRLFGETDRDRRLRLRALELIEERGHDRQGGQNDFRKALEDVEKVERERQSKGAREKGKKKDESAANAVGVLDLNLIKTDPDKLYPLIYYALKRTLKEWEEAMDDRPEDVKRTTQGKLAAATQVQSAEYLKPLFRQLRSRNLPPDVLARIAEIVHFMQTRQYQKANDSYLRLSIGNAPWPIGVTMVGIHERSAREKISSDQVAHVLNDEVSRKYIQSLKRLLTFSQTKYPPDDVSQLMG
ncbi:Prp18 domain-containing protein [Schizophyllum commune]|uniref:Prp18-domain-containing protein n=1 Tax=Schizophyllum commune (strain H4-8 / FGSC 9210) TaxID=578458 RepID=UPI002160BD55|nr:Prp18-domain-containing protein [Schizophyllum commune H4-8]KAI5831474.1 Prp18-domain-containing protein [Schizophyllum commune Tattone D]KAI5892363.1 Prp18-domain-containing protein [Schizophyllum commune H4-8]